MGFITNQDFVSALLDKITDIRCFMADKYAKADTDMIHLGDDVGVDVLNPIQPECMNPVQLKNNMVINYHFGEL